MLPDTSELMDTARRLSSAQLQNLMGLSKSLGDLNHQRFQEMSQRIERLGDSSARDS